MKVSRRPKHNLYTLRRQRRRGRSFLRSLSTSGAEPSCSGLGADSTRSRSLTHIAALDMSADAGRPDRLVVPAGDGSGCHSLRRQKLTSRSQLSSSEYFLVTFEVGGGVDADPLQADEEYVVAAKGTTLEEALSGPCLKRGIALSAVCVLLEGCNVDLASTSLHTESSLLAGKQLRIRAKHDAKTGKAVLSRAATTQPPTLRKTSGSVRNNRRFFSTSTEDPSCTAAAPPAPDFLGLETQGKKASKQRWSVFFGNNKDTKIEALTEQLDSYTKHGIPKDPNGGADADLRLHQLEKNWRDLVEGSDALPERLQQQQDAIWELLHTEIAYIRTLTVVKDLFLACLTSLQEARILTDVDKTRLFSNVVDIHAANVHFWEQYLAPLVAATRDTRQPLNPHHLLDGFHKFDEIFRPYVQYCVEQVECQKYCRQQSEGELFTVYLAWCETQSACDRLRLVDILVKPMQRLTKYSLLLKAIHKMTDCEEQRQGLDYMIRRVDDFVNSVNSRLRERQDQDRLRAIIARIENYDVVESKDEDLEKIVRLYSDLDLTRPMPDCPSSQHRYLLYEGDLRLRDLNNSKVDVRCFLMTDMLLVCKATSKKGESRTARVRVLRPPYLVERLVVQELPRDPPTLACVYLNEYKVATTAFLLSSPEAKVVKTWNDMIRKARGLYAQAKQAAGSTPGVSLPHHAPPLSQSRQPSSLYDEDTAPSMGLSMTLSMTLSQHEDDAPEGDAHADTHSCASYSLGLYPQRSPRGSTRGSSLNHSHSGSVEMNEASSLSSVSHSRGISVDNNELRASSLSSDEGIPPLGADHQCATSRRSLRRPAQSKSPSPNTLSIQVPVFSSLGQSLPNLNLAASHSGGVQPPSSLLLVPPSGKLHQHHGPLSPGHRGTSYPPPSPPRGSLHRGLALVASRNPPLMKMRHVSSVGVPSLPSQQSCSSGCSAWVPPPPPGQQAATDTLDLDVPVLAGAASPQQQGAEAPPGQSSAAGTGTGPRQAFVTKRLTRGENRRYHTAGAVDDVKKAEGRDASIQKRFSWNYGPQSCAKRQLHAAQDGLDDGAGGGQISQVGHHQDVLLIDRATSPLEPPPQNITDAAWSHVHAGSMGSVGSMGSTERNPFAEPVLFQSPSVGSSPSVSLCGDCSPCPAPGVAAATGAVHGVSGVAGAAGGSVTSSPALSTSSPVGPVQLPSLNTSPTMGMGPMASSNPFLEDVGAQDEPSSGAASDEVLVLITDAQTEQTTDA
ncbi:pleckstrin homology domain-containing family G member 5 isoform X2 [Thrips palmi]|uniref:Pleckstrin homology domain-containing family G member 5 isoform X2 n=1 Tax=Thrips palmi TaxID=161013 RepID=A0A6P8YKT5_THRPL|nr:pleckstrin homology domain-containing family G member 5 isoform X2 [Thrips palmi]